MNKGSTDRTHSLLLLQAQIKLTSVKFKKEASHAFFPSNKEKRTRIAINTRTSS